LQEGRLQAHTSKSAQKVSKMATNSKDTKGLGKALIDAVGFLSFLFGSLILLAIVFGAIGSIFMSTKRLFQLRRVKKDEDNSHSEPEGPDG
jgi:hypothetical protein